MGHIPLFGTMAYSYIQAHERETEVFADFARSHPHANTMLNANTMLIGTYDTRRGGKADRQRHHDPGGAH
jgi:nicotinate phosphoribosyltransferase